MGAAGRVNREEMSANKVEAPKKCWVAITAIVLAALVSGCVGGGPAYELKCEIRRRLSQPIPFDGNLEAVTQHSMSGHHLRTVKRSVQGEYAVLEHGKLIYEDTRRAIVMKPAGEPAQVFILPIPYVPKNSDWSEWRRPDYADATPAPDLRFMHEGRPKTDILPVPSIFFEMRFKVRLWDSRPDAPQQP